MESDRYEPESADVVGAWRSRAEGDEEQALEVAVRWGESEVLRIDHVHPIAPYFADVIDERGRARPALVERELMVHADTRGVRVIFPFGSEGSLVRAGAHHPLAALLASGEAYESSVVARAHECALAPGEVARVGRGPLVYEVRLVPLSKRLARRSLFAIDYRKQVWTALSFAVHGLLLATMSFLPPQASALSIDALNADLRPTRYLLTMPELTDLQRLEGAASSEAGGREGQRAHDAEGQMGQSTAPKSDRRFAVKRRDAGEVRVARELSAKEVQNVGILAALQRAAGGVASPSAFDENSANGYDAQDALGSMFGGEVGENFGFGGLGMRGTGRGGGGDGAGTIGLGRVGTIGVGSGGEGDHYGRGAGKLGGRTARVPRLRVEHAEVRGSLSKEVIRRVIHTHLNEVRHCYEQELSARPDLEGRVAIKFVVAPSGAVQAAGVASSTLGSSRVEACIEAAARRWTFPAPDGGGVVIVSYPFVFQNGQ